MREILFRGKRMDNGEWIEGSLLKVTIKNKIYHLVFEDSFSFDGKNVKALLHGWVDPKTVGQYTGLTDNGKKIFEGDIVKVTDDDGEFSSCDCGCGKVIFLDGMWYVDEDVNNGLFNLNNAYYIEIIGNIHDNPELLEVDNG